MNIQKMKSFHRLRLTAMFMGSIALSFSSAWAGLKPPTCNVIKDQDGNATPAIQCTYQSSDNGPENAACTISTLGTNASGKCYLTKNGPEL